MVNKGTMADPVKKIPNTVQTSEKGTNADPVKLPQKSKVEERSNKQDPKEIQVPYCHPNHKNCYNQQQDQAKYKHVSMKVDLGWITPEKMQHITSGIQILYCFVSSSITTTKTKDHEKIFQARTQR
jgi:hypothetical protein